MGKGAIWAKLVAFGGGNVVFVLSVPAIPVSVLPWVFLIYTISAAVDFRFFVLEVYDSLASLKSRMNAIVPRPDVLHALSRSKIYLSDILIKSSSISYISIRVAL